MSNVEEFTLVPLKLFSLNMKNQPFKTQVKEVSDFKINLRQLSIINRMRSRDQNEAQINRKISVQCSGVIVVEKYGSKIQTDGQYKSLKTNISFTLPLEILKV